MNYFEVPETYSCLPKIPIVNAVILIAFTAIVLIGLYYDLKNIKHGK